MKRVPLDNRLGLGAALGGMILLAIAGSLPELAITIPELTERTFSPHEGFVLSRINGQWDVKSIMKISPMKELEVLMIFQHLLRDRVIRWKKP